MMQEVRGSSAGGCEVRIFRIKNRVKQEVRGSSAGDREARIFRAKNRVTSDLQRATVWLSSRAPPRIKKILYFFILFFWIS
jgi:hypothetical protein